MLNWLLQHDCIGKYNMLKKLIVADMSAVLSRTLNAMWVFMRTHFEICAACSSTDPRSIFFVSPYTHGRRTITIFSPTGAFSIESGHDEESGDKLLLSYHDNGHYNSVRDENVEIKPISNCIAVTNVTEDENALNGGRRKKKKKTKANTKSSRMGEGDCDEERKESGGCEASDAFANVNDESREEHSSDRVEQYCETNHAKTPTKEEKAENSKRPVVLHVRKNDPCSCGSGLRYKKCCLAVEKSKIRTAKWKERHRLDAGFEEEGAGGDEDKDKEVNLDSPFRVLKI